MSTPNLYRVQFNMHHVRGDVCEAVVDIDALRKHAVDIGYLELGDKSLPHAEAVWSFLAASSTPYSITPGELELEDCVDIEGHPTDPWDSLTGEGITPADGLPQEFLDKRQSLAMFLLALATGMTWEDALGADDYHANYTKDADEILRSQPHLLGLETRERMGLE